MVRFALHGAAHVGAALRGDARLGLSRLPDGALVAHIRLLVRQGRASLLSRQHLFQQARRERPQGVLEPRQRLGDGRPRARAAVPAAGSPIASALRAAVSRDGREDPHAAATRWILEIEPARPGTLLAAGNEWLGLLYLRVGVGRERWAAG